MRLDACLALVAISTIPNSVHAQGAGVDITLALSRLAAADTEVERQFMAEDLARRLASIPEDARETWLGGLNAMRIVAGRTSSWLDPADPRAPRAFDVGKHTVRWLEGDQGRMVVQVDKPLADPNWVLRRTFRLGGETVEHLETSVVRVTGNRVMATWNRAEPGLLTIGHDQHGFGTARKFKGTLLMETILHDQARNVHATRDRHGNVHIRDGSTGAQKTIPAPRRSMRR